MLAGKLYKPAFYDRENLKPLFIYFYYCNWQNGGGLF